MSFLKRIFLMACLGLFFVQASHADAEDDEPEYLGRIRIGAEASLGRSFISGSREFKTDEKKSHMFLGPAVNLEYLIVNWWALGNPIPGLV